jgi:hypothetical protein
MKRQFFERKLHAFGFVQRDGVYRRKNSPVRIQVIGNVAKVWNESRNFDGIGKANYYSFDRLAHADGLDAVYGGQAQYQTGGSSSNSTRKEDGFDPYVSWGDPGSLYEWYYEGNGIWSARVKGTGSSGDFYSDPNVVTSGTGTNTTGTGSDNTNNTGTDSAGSDSASAEDTTGTNTGESADTDTGIFTGTSTGFPNTGTPSPNVGSSNTGTSIVDMLKKYWWVILIVILIFSQSNK